MSDTIPVYRGLARAFRLEDVDTIFVLTGDGNMHWEAALSEDEEVKAFHVWHEHCTVATASAYAVASGKVGVASVTCGPGVTQLMTALATAANSRIPLVVFAGESPINASWYNQEIGQGPLVEATGAHYIAAHSLRRMFEYVSEVVLYCKDRASASRARYSDRFAAGPDPDRHQICALCQSDSGYRTRGAASGLRESGGRGYCASRTHHHYRGTRRSVVRCQSALRTTGGKVQRPAGDDAPGAWAFRGQSTFPRDRRRFFASCCAPSLCRVRSGCNCGCQSDPSYDRRRKTLSAGCGRANRSGSARHQAWSKNCAYLLCERTAPRVCLQSSRVWGTRLLTAARQRGTRSALLVGPGRTLLIQCPSTYRPDSSIRDNW